MGDNGLHAWSGLLAGFHFLRPWWLCLVPVIGLGIWFVISRRTSAGWSGSIDKDKLVHLGVHSGSSKVYYYFGLALIVATVALAGPSVSSLPGKTGHSSQARVFVLDLSPSMLARDISPDRLTVAKLKLIDLLRLQTDHQSALVVYSAKAHKVTPLIDDPRITESLVDVLHPGIMPQQGSNAEAAVALASQLIADGGYSQGDIVLITDGLHDDALAAIRGSWQQSLRLSILAVGTEAGAPIPDADAGKNGSSATAFMHDSENNVVRASLKVEPLKVLAAELGGRFSEITSDSTDVKYLTDLALFTGSADVHEATATYDQFHDSGYWLVLALLPAVLLGFRKNVLWVIVPLVMVAPDSHAFGWADLWLTKDQQAQRAVDRGDFDTASRLFQNKPWLAVSLYRQKQYITAVDALSSPEYADDLFNRGNAQALSGDLDGALLSYRIAQQLYTTEEEKQNTEHNIRLVRHLLDRPQDEEENSNGNGAGGDAMQGDTKSEQLSEAAGDNEQAPVGGVAGGVGTLQQQAMDEGASGGSVDHELALDLVPTDANKSREGQAPDTRLGIEIRSSDADGNPVIAEENANLVLSPYSEQWLRELPADPGGYMRRKFAYQSQLRESLTPDSEQTRGKVRY